MTVWFRTCPRKLGNRRCDAPVANDSLSSACGRCVAALRGKLPSKAKPEPLLRYFDCVNYERCLDLAVACNWTSFTCRECPLSPELPVNSKDFAIDEFAIARRTA